MNRPDFEPRPDPEIPLSEERGHERFFKSKSGRVLVALGVAALTLLVSYPVISDRVLGKPVSDYCIPPLSVNGGVTQAQPWICYQNVTPVGEK